MFAFFNIYNKDTGFQLGTFYLENIMAELYGMLGRKERFSV